MSTQELTEELTEKLYAPWQESISEYHQGITKAQVDAMAPIDKAMPIIVMQEADGVRFSVNGKQFRGKTWNGIGPLRLHLRQFSPDKLVDWEVIRFKLSITSAIPAIDLYEVGSRPPEVNEVDDSLDAARFRFCMKWGWPQPKARWAREEPHKFEFWLPSEEMSFCICHGMTKEEAIDEAMQKVKEANEREARGELN